MDLHENFLQMAVMNEKGEVLENSRISLKQADSSMKISMMKRFD